MKKGGGRGGREGEKESREGGRKAGIEEERRGEERRGEERRREARRRQREEGGRGEVGRGRNGKEGESMVRRPVCSLCIEAPPLPDGYPATVTILHLGAKVYSQRTKQSGREERS